MKVLSIDIGIKNLAYTIIENNSYKIDENFNIIKWNCVSLCSQTPKCEMKKCKKKAKYTINKYFYCEDHIELDKFKINTYKNFNKMNIFDLIKIAEEHDITFEKNINKINLMKLLNENLKKNYYSCIENINANTINLIDIGINMREEFDKIFKKFDIKNIDMILLENQISPIANRMKTIQGMIAQYFINNCNYNIEFISSINKLKPFYPDKKTNYSERKKLGILITSKLLEHLNKNNDFEFFKKHQKKDDLSDCLLQGLYYLNSFDNLKIPNII